LAIMARLCPYCLARWIRGSSRLLLILDRPSEYHIMVLLLNLMSIKLT
jgi:hypothetical protein